MADKELQLENIRKELLSTTDALGMPIDPGIFEVIVLLNALGYSTSGSCEGDALPYAWIDFNTPEEIRQEKLAETEESPYWTVHNHARKIANESIREKFGKDYIDSLRLWTKEVNDYWDEVFVRERDSHSLSSEYRSIQDKIMSEKEAMATKLQTLKDDFLASIGENRGALCIQKNLSRICFCTEEVERNTEIGINSQIHERSNYLLEKFEHYLKERYLN